MGKLYYSALKAQFAPLEHAVKQLVVKRHEDFLDPELPDGIAKAKRHNPSRSALVGWLAVSGCENQKRYWGCCGSPSI